MGHDMNGPKFATARERSRDLPRRRALRIEQNRFDLWPQ
jgi:hypothetical protein